MVTNLSKKPLLTLLVVLTSAACAFSQSGTRVEAQGTDSILFYNNNVKTAALSNTGSFRLGTIEAFQATALFQLNSASQGFLAPRMTTTDRGNIVAPATGLLIYNTTTNQFDYYDGAAWLSVFSSATGDDGDWTISGADMYSGVSGNVGIGTSTPGKIAGSSKYFTLSRGDAAGSPTSSDDDVSIELHGGSSAGVGVQSKIEFIARTTSGSDVNTGRIEMTNSSTNTGHGVMRFYTNGGGSLLERVTIIETGNVGIGNTNPSVKLDVTGSANILSSSADPLVVRSSTDGFALRVKESDNGNDAVSVFGYGTRGRITMNSNGVTNINFDADGSLDSYINAGNVGIGTATPSAKLHVSGGDGIMLVENGNNSSEMQMASLGTGSQKLNTAGTKGYRMWVYGDSYAPNPALQGDYRMAYVSGTGHTSIFNIDRSGKVGIGLSGLGDEPQTTLDVNGQITMQSGAVNGYLPVSDANGTMTWTDPATITTGDDGDWIVSGADMYSGVSGNVGIGTSSPGKIVGSSKYFTLSRGDAAGSPTSSDDDVSIELHGGSDAGVGVQSKIEFIARTTSGSDVNTGRIEMTNSSTNTGHGVMRFYTNGGGALLERVTILETGNVGIGTTLPSTPLAILGNGGVQPVGITQNSVGGTATMELTTQDGAGNQATRLKFGGNGNTPDAVFYSGASGSETATVHIEGTNGNVGIGTTAPAYKLDVSGEARIGYMGSPDTIQLIPSDFIIVFGESAMHQFGENWGIGPIQGQGPQHFMAQIPMPVGYKARKVVIKTYRADNNYLGNPHDCLIWNMKNQISQTGAPPFATASVTGDGVSIATFSEIVAHGNSYIGIEVKDIPELPGGPGDPPQEMITGGYVLINPIVP